MVKELKNAPSSLSRTGNENAEAYAHPSTVRAARLYPFLNGTRYTFFYTTPRIGAFQRRF